MRARIHYKKNGKYYSSNKVKTKVILTAGIMTLLGSGLFLMLWIRGYTKSAIVPLLVFWTMEAVAMSMPYFTMHYGYVSFEDVIEVRAAFYDTKYLWKKKRIFQYEQIRKVIVSDCPLVFSVNKEHYEECKQDWRQEFGAYIIAYGEKDRLLFACSYQDAVWNLLKNKCQTTAEYMMSEQEYIDYVEQEKRKADEIRAQVEEQNGYQEIMDKFDGYVN